MSGEERATVVVFRKWQGGRDGHGVIALFPDIDHIRQYGMVSSFEHVGQHGAADYTGVVTRTRPAKPAEFADLKKELESPPYNYKLRTVMRRPGKLGS